MTDFAALAKAEHEKLSNTEREIESGFNDVRRRLLALWIWSRDAANESPTMDRDTMRDTIDDDVAELGEAVLRLEDEVKYLHERLHVLAGYVQANEVAK